MKNNYQFIVLVVLFIHSFTATGQFLGPGSNWYFGDQAGVSWTTLQANGDPMYLMDGQIVTQEGVATISDEQGNLLFYTDGIEVWNSLHQVMTNSLASSTGGNLTGDPSSTQSGVIVPKPNDTTTYYVFTVDAQLNTGGLAYSKVDMTMNTGIGNVDLTEKNIALFNPAAEKITAVNHANGTDIWVITHQWNNNQFNAYLVTSSGVQVSSPVCSTIGAIHTGSSYNSIGYMKASPGGNMLALAISGIGNTGLVELFQFNTTTGQLSNCVSLGNSSMDDPYGIEFSPDETYLYASELGCGNINQWNITNYNASSISSSHQLSATILGATIGALQLAPDQMIYLAKLNSFHLGRINNPNLPGLASNYEDLAIVLGPTELSAKQSRLGLPTFISTFFVPLPQFGYESSCDHDTVFFNIPNNPVLDTAYWNFNWPSQNPQYHTTTTCANSSFIYPSSGLFTVELITKKNQCFDTFYVDVPVSKSPIADLGLDQTLCDDDTLLFDLSFNDTLSITGGFNYLWEAQLSTMTYYDSSATLLIDKPGTYSIIIYGDSICPGDTDVVVVEYNNLIVNLGTDVTNGLCLGDVHTLDASYANTQYGQSAYLWNTGATSPIINATFTGVYSVTVENGQCTAIDSIYLAFDNPLQSPLGPDANICNGTTQTLNAGNPGANYAWSIGTNTQEIIVAQSGTYSVTISNACGSIIDEITLSSIDIPDIDLGPDFTMCEGIFETIDAYVENSTYQWSNNELTPQISISTGGNYCVTVTNECGSDSDNIFVYTDIPLTNLNLGPDTAICSGFILDCGHPNLQYYWSNNETTQTITITQSDIYGIDIINACGTFSDIIQIDVIEMNLDLGTDTVLCPGSSIIFDAQNPGAAFTWSDGSTDQSMEITQAGLFWVSVSNVCETQTDTILVTEYNMLLNLGNDTSFCDSETLFLDAGHPGSEYIWSTGETTQSVICNQTGIYSVAISHFCGNLTDEIEVEVLPSPEIDFGSDTIYISNNLPIELNPNTTGTVFQWSDGSSDTIAFAPNAGIYGVTIYNEHGCTDTGSVVVTYKIGIDELDISSTVLLYPNPAQDKLFIHIEKLKVEAIYVLNSMGSLVQKINTESNEIALNTSSLSEGLYFVIIQTPEHKRVVKPFAVMQNGP